MRCKITSINSSIRFRLHGAWGAHVETTWGSYISNLGPGICYVGTWTLWNRSENQSGVVTLLFLSCCFVCCGSGSTSLSSIRGTGKIRNPKPLNRVIEGRRKLLSLMVERAQN